MAKDNRLPAVEEVEVYSTKLEGCYVLNRGNFYTEGIEIWRRENGNEWHGFVFYIDTAKAHVDTLYDMKTSDINSIFARAYLNVIVTRDPKDSYKPGGLKIELINENGERVVAMFACEDEAVMKFDTIKHGVIEKTLMDIPFGVFANKYDYSYYNK